VPVSAIETQDGFPSGSFPVKIAGVAMQLELVDLEAAQRRLESDCRRWEAELANLINKQNSLNISKMPREEQIKLAEKINQASRNVDWAREALRQIKLRQTESA